MKDHVTIKHAMEYLCLSESTIRRLLKKGTLSNVKHRHKVYIPLTELDAVKAEREETIDIIIPGLDSAVDTSDTAPTESLPAFDNDQVKEFIREEVKRAVQEEVQVLIPVQAVDRVADESLTRSERKLVTKFLSGLQDALHFLDKLIQKMIDHLERKEA